MQEARPSMTALRVALRRAAHQVYDPPPLVFEDPIAVRILGPAQAEELGKTATRLEKPASVSLRAYLVARSRFAEDALAGAVASGVRQYVLLGAGLDTFAHRNPFPGLRVFEVDHPATQAWKRGLLAAAGLAGTSGLSFAPVDFERQSLGEGLAAAGFAFGEPAFFACLGVVPYLTREAFQATVSVVRGCVPGSGIVLDYGQPREALPQPYRRERDSLAARVAAAGEPFQIFFRPAEIASEFSGFAALEDLDPGQINARYFAARTDGLHVRGSGGHFFCAWK